MTPVFLRADTTIRALVRRRLTLAVLVAMPVVFYLVTRDTPGRSVRSLVFGISWAVSTVAFFASVSALDIEPRLIVAGWRRGQLLAGRLLGLVMIVVALTAVYSAIIGVDQDVRSLAAVAIDFAVTGMVAVAVGATVAAVVAKEMEGTLVLFFLAGLQAIANPFESWSRLLPFWSSRELGTWAVDGSQIGSLADGLLHAAVVVTVCGLVVGGSAMRLPSARARGNRMFRRPLSG